MTRDFKCEVSDPQGFREGYLRVWVRDDGRVELTNFEEGRASWTILSQRAVTELVAFLEEHKPKATLEERVAQLEAEVKMLRGER